MAAVDGRGRGKAERGDRDRQAVKLESDLIPRPIRQGCRRCCARGGGYKLPRTRPRQPQHLPARRGRRGRPPNCGVLISEYIVKVLHHRDNTPLYTQLRSRSFIPLARIRKFFPHHVSSAFLHSLPRSLSALFPLPLAQNHSICAVYIQSLYHTFLSCCARACPAARLRSRLAR